jgi:hypothetical protein
MRALAAGLVGVPVALGVLALRCDPAARAPALGATTRSHVDDPAGVLGPFGILVEKLCATTRDDLGIDVRVATRRAAAADLAVLAERLFDALGAGDRTPTGGVLILLETVAGRARIEVSYSLEGVFPDAVVAALARDQLVPYASHRAAGMAVMDVVHFLRDRALDAIAAGDLALAPSLRGADRLDALLAGRSGGAGAEVALPELPSHGEWKRRLPDAIRARYAPSSDPLESAAAFRRAQRDLAGDPTLELFTEGSRIMRARGPVAPYEELLRARATDRSEPLTLAVRGDRALLDSRSPARGFVPILLVREQGLWRIDLVETYKNFFFDATGAYRLVNRATPYAALLPDAKAASDPSLVPLDLEGEPFEAAITRLERSDAPSARFELAELLMRNCWVSAEAIVLYVEAARAAPAEPLFAATLADRASYLGMPEVAIEPIARLGPPYWPRLAQLHERAGEAVRAKQLYEKALARDPGSPEARAGLERLARRAARG